MRVQFGFRLPLPNGPLICSMTLSRDLHSLLPSNIKRTAKGMALELVAARSSVRPGTLSSAALGMMRIGLEPGLSSGYEGGARAACCVSVDFDVTAGERYRWNHDGTAALLGLSEKYGIPLTWAICGKTAVDDPSAYESIIDSGVRQEVGVHTYSHIYADNTTEYEFEQDIRKCVSVLGLSSPPTSFVFPKNREGHFGLLRRLGFKSFRGAKRVIGAPVTYAGLWNIRPVYYVDQKSLRAAGLMKRFIDACIAKSAVFHLWTHPWSLAIDGKVERMVSEALDPVFESIEEKRNSGLLAPTTMGGVSKFLAESKHDAGRFNENRPG